MKKVDFSKVKRVLIIRPGAIGDVLLTTPFIRTLKQAYPEIEIDYLVRPFAAEVLKGNPYLSNIVLLQKNRLKKTSAFVKMIHDIRFYVKMAKGQYDLVFDLYGNLRTALISFFVGARYRVGFTFRGRKYFYNIKVVPDKEPKYNVYYHMDLLKAVGVEPGAEELDFTLKKEDRDYIAKFYEDVGISTKDTIVGLNPAGTWITKTWPEYKFSALGNIIREKIPQAKIVVLWGPGEKDVADSVLHGIKDRKNTFLAPATNIAQLGALMESFHVLATNDGAPKHISIAVRTATVTVFGPTNYKSWNPHDNDNFVEVHSMADCAPCDKTNCPDGDIECMKNIDEDEVFEKMKRLLERQK